MMGPLQCLCTCQTQIFHRLTGVVTATVMTGEFLQMVIESQSVQRFDGSTSALMQQLSPFNQD